MDTALSAVAVKLTHTERFKTAQILFEDFCPKTSKVQFNWVKIMIPADLTPSEETKEESSPVCGFLEAFCMSLLLTIAASSRLYSHLPSLVCSISL